MTEALRSRVGAGDQAKHCVDGNDGGTAIADQWKSQTDNGHNTDAHAGIDHQLEHQCGSRAEADNTAHIVWAPHAHLEAAGNDQHFQNHNHHTAHEAQFLK